MIIFPLNLCVVNMAGCCCDSSSCKDNELCDYTLNHDNPDLFDRSQVFNTLTYIMEVPGLLFMIYGPFIQQHFLFIPVVPRRTG